MQQVYEELMEAVGSAGATLAQTAPFVRSQTQRDATRQQVHLRTATSLSADDSHLLIMFEMREGICLERNLAPDRSS